MRVVLGGGIAYRKSKTNSQNNENSNPCPPLRGRIWHVALSSSETDNKYEINNFIYFYARN